MSRRAIVALAAIAVLCVDPHPRARSRPHRAERARGAEGGGARRLSSRSASRSGPAAPARDRVGDAAVPLSGMLLALVPIMFTYSGWNAADVRGGGSPRSRPQRSACARSRHGRRHRHLCGAEHAVSLRAAGRRSSRRCRGALLDVVGERLFGAGAATSSRIFTIISLSASISAMTLAGPRVYYAMAQDGLFLPAAARVHPRFRTPAFAIVAQAIWSARSRAVRMAVAACELHGLCGGAVLSRRRVVRLRPAPARARTPRVRSARGAIHGRPASSSSPAPRWWSTR